MPIGMRSSFGNVYMSSPLRRPEEAPAVAAGGRSQAIRWPVVLVIPGMAAPTAVAVR
jgi:hypothetical protein